MPYRSNKPGFVRSPMLRPGMKPNPRNTQDVEPVVVTAPQPDRTKSGDKVRVTTGDRRPSGMTTTETTFDTEKGNFTVNNTWINYTNGYNVFNEKSERVGFDGDKSNTLYENPYQIQEQPSLDAPVTAKTLCNVVDASHILPFHNESNVEWVYEALSDIFAIQRKEIVKNTGGGTATTSKVFTLETWLEYHHRYSALFAYAAELASRQAWSAQVPKSNLLLRDMATACALTNTLELRNKASRVLSQAALPSKLVQYLLWYFQVYKANDHDYSIDQFFVSREFFNAFCNDDSTGEFYTAYETKINSLVDNVSPGHDDAADMFPQLTALIEEKSNQPYVNLRNATVPSNTTAYDADWNDIFNLQPSLVVTAGTVASQEQVPPKTTAGSSCPAAFRRDKNNVPNHVLASLGANQTISGYRGFIRPQYRFENSSSASTTTLNTNKHVLFSDSSSVTGVKSKPRFTNLAASMMGNDFANVFSLDALVSYDYAMSPKGEAAYLFEVTETNTRMAARSFMFELFGVQV